MGLLDDAGKFLNSDQGEQLSDQAIQAGSDAANKATGDKYSEQIGQAGTFADGHVGNEGSQGNQANPGNQGA